MCGGVGGWGEMQYLVPGRPSEDFNGVLRSKTAYDVGSQGNVGNGLNHLVDRQDIHFYDKLEILSSVPKRFYL